MRKVAGSGTQNISFNFNGAVGEHLKLSSFLLSLSTYVLAESGASLNGSFTIAAVPEPETYAMLMAGLASLFFWVRKSRDKVRDHIVLLAGGQGPHLHAFVMFQK